MKGTPQPNVVIRVPRYGTVPAPPEVIEAAQTLSEKSGTPLKPHETIDPHSNVGESVVSILFFSCITISSATIICPKQGQRF